jgi:hypothetical protein
MVRRASKKSSIRQQQALHNYYYYYCYFTVAHRANLGLSIYVGSVVRDRFRYSEVYQLKVSLDKHEISWLQVSCEGEGEERSVRYAVYGHE